MGFLDLFKKDYWRNSKKMVESENEENSRVVKTSFQVRYQLVFKGDEYGLDQNDKCFENKPCYNSTSSDGSESDCRLCRKLMELDKLYTRSEIESISTRLGYDVFANVGGAVDENGFPNCSCKWEDAVIVNNKNLFKNK